jgi:methionine sulfoxide reductase heme-binding subunit
MCALQGADTAFERDGGVWGSVILMLILVSFVCMALFVAVCRGPIKRHPAAFYGGAFVLDVALLYGYSHPLPEAAWRYVLVFVQRCMFAQALLAIVMFVGVLGEGSPIRRWLLPIRGELSIIAAILVLGHAVPHLPFLGRVLSDVSVLRTGKAASFAVSILLLGLLAVLTATSLNAVRRRMDAKGWKRIQLLAYPFFFLTYVHLVLVLADPAMAGADTAIQSILAYTIVFLGYAVLRLRKAVGDCRGARVTGRL